MKQDCAHCKLKSKAALRLNEEETERLSGSCALVKFSKGDILIKQGVFSTNVAYLRTGLAKVHIAGPYYEQIVRIVKAPCYLGLPTTFGDKINQYSVTAIEEVEVCYIDITTFRHLLHVNPEFSNEIMMDLCKNELEMFYRCAKRTQKQLRGKIADVLLELADGIYNSLVFPIPFTQEELGNLVDSSRESVSRVFAEFERDGILKYSGKHVEICNKDLLVIIGANG